VSNIILHELDAFAIDGLVQVLCRIGRKILRDFGLRSNDLITTEAWDKPKCMLTTSDWFLRERTCFV